MEKPKSFSKAPGYYDWVRVIFIYSFLYLYIFSVNKFLKKFLVLITTVNKTFYNLSHFKFFCYAEAVLQRCSPGGGCSVGVLRSFGSLSVRGCDFNKVAEFS